jgi:hypothetical protein
VTHLKYEEPARPPTAVTHLKYEESVNGADLFTFTRSRSELLRVAENGSPHERMAYNCHAYRDGYCNACGRRSSGTPCHTKY